MKKSTICVLSILCATVIPSLNADEITDAIDEGAGYYKDGNYTEAVSSLNYAVQLINQKASQQLGEFFPEAPDGWEMAEPQYQSAGISIFGGGNSAEASYTNGDQQVKMTIAANSPALQSLLMFVNNPAFLGASGKKIEKIGGQKALIEWNGDSGNINVIVANSTLVTFEGYNTTLDTVKEFANSVEYKKLAVALMQ